MRTRKPLLALAIALGVAAIVASRATPAAASACLTCNTYFYCGAVSAGARSCWSGNLGNVPFCTLVGACPGGDGGGAEDDFIPRRSSPAIEGAAAAGGVDESQLFWLTMPLDAHAAARLGERAVVLRDAADPARPERVVVAVARHVGVAPGALAVANAEALLGPARQAASFVAPDDAGYTIEAESTAGGATVGVCRVDARSARARLALESIGPSDLLLVPLRLEGEACVMALSVAPPFGDDPAGRDARARLSRAFHEAGRRLAGAGRHRGYRMTMLPVTADCW